MTNEKILSLIVSTARAAALIALSLACAAAASALSAEPDIKITFDKFEPGLMSYGAPGGNAYHILGSEDLVEWSFLDTTVSRDWSPSTYVWFRHTQPQRFFHFIKDADFSFPGWDDLEDYELELSFKPLRITQGKFRVMVYTSAAPMPQDGSDGIPWGQASGSIEDSLDIDGNIRISSQPAWEVQMAGIQWFQIQIELESSDGRHAQIVVGKHLSDWSKYGWPFAPGLESKLTVNGPPSDWATGYLLIVPEDEEIPIAE